MATSKAKSSGKSKDVSGPLRVLDLFSGIGGFSLGLERAGMQTVAFCEQDGYACRVLRKHWPTLPIFEDVCTLTKSRLKSHGIEANVICGGFPCQDISTAGKGAGLDGARSGLWREYARLIREIRPAYAVMENVAALRSRGLDRVLGDLAAIGYDAEWHCIPASAVGAPHIRDRCWIVAYPVRRGASRGAGPLVREGVIEAYPGYPATPQVERDGPTLADPAGEQVRRLPRRSEAEISMRRLGPRNEDWPYWSPEPNLPRVADGIPDRLDRNRCLGNAVVPQVVELIGRAIVADHAACIAAAQLEVA